jgi:hypothetical protein
MGLNYKILTTQRQVLDSVTCDRCHKEVKKVSEGGWQSFSDTTGRFNEPHFEDYVVIEQHWGYFSNKDGQRDRAVICESCYDVLFHGVDIHVEE